MNKILEINYSESVKNYNLQLISKLRDFGEKHLQLWVPDENVVLSILNMIYSVSQNNIKTLSILLGNKDLSDKDLIILEKPLQKFSSCNILKEAKNYTLQISDINNKILEETLNNYTEEIKNAFLKNKSDKKKIIKKNINNSEKNFNIKLEQIKNLYSNIKKDENFPNFISEDVLKKLSTKSDYFFSEKDDIKIILKIVKGIVLEAKYNCSKSNFDKFFLDKFCSLVYKLPIQESYEHGVMKLEYFSRSSVIKKEIKGIVTPLVIKKIFSKIQILMRSIWILYCNKNELKPSKNLFDKSPALEWINLEKNKKIEKIKKTLDTFQKENNIDCLIFDELYDDCIRVTLNFKDENVSDNIDKSVILLNFEKYIRKKLERRIEIFYKESKDANKLRGKNTPI